MSTNPEKVITLQPKAGTFDFKDAPPFALAYLSTYYKQPPTADETAVSIFLLEQFYDKAPKGRFIEIGCGPTMHHVFPFAPYVDEIHMADYLEENLEQVRLWKDSAPGAHQWSEYAAMTLRHEGKDPSNIAVTEREKLARQKISKLMQCDLKQETPKERKGQYDCVGCFYCAEEIGISIEEWQRVVGRVADYLRPGGVLYMSALAGMNYYQVRDSSGTSVDYPCACITEEVVKSSLPALGFDKDSISIKTSDIEHPDCGVTGTLMVSAIKKESLGLG